MTNENYSNCAFSIVFKNVCCLGNNKKNFSHNEILSKNIFIMSTEHYKIIIKGVHMICGTFLVCWNHMMVRIKQKCYFIFHENLPLKWAVNHWNWIIESVSWFKNYMTTCFFVSYESHCARLYDFDLLCREQETCQTTRCYLIILRLPSLTTCLLSSIARD